MFGSKHILLLVLAAFVLEPDANHAWIEARHLHQLLLHQRVRPRIGAIARAQRMQLLLVEYGSDACRLSAPTPAAPATVARVAVPVMNEKLIINNRTYTVKNKILYFGDTLCKITLLRVIK